MAQYLELSIDEVDFDLENPRIKMALEKYGDNVNAERIFFALKTAKADQVNATVGFDQLKASIRGYGGIAQPIVVVKKNGKKVCIDGNTRLAIFKDFNKDDKVVGDWSKIQAILISEASQIDIEKIRASAHMVGAREWPAYEKARYLHYLYNQELMSFGQMIELCGGNKAEIERQIDAFNDMNEYYRDISEDDEFKIDRFSGFVELQNSKVKEAIFKTGLELKDFGEWIKNGQIYKLTNVRQLPKVLRDEEARKIFLEGGINSISKAIRHLDSKNRSSPSDDNFINNNVRIISLAQILKQRLDEMPRTEYLLWRKGEADDAIETVQTLEDLMGTLEEILQDVGK